MMDVNKYGLLFQHSPFVFSADTFDQPLAQLQASVVWLVELVAHFCDAGMIGDLKYFDYSVLFTIRKRGQSYKL